MFGFPVFVLYNGADGVIGMTAWTSRQSDVHLFSFGGDSSPANMVGWRFAGTAPRYPGDSWRGSGSGGSMYGKAVTPLGTAHGGFR